VLIALRTLQAGHALDCILQGRFQLDGASMRLKQRRFIYRQPVAPPMSDNAKSGVTQCLWLFVTIDFRRGEGAWQKSRPDGLRRATHPQRWHGFCVKSWTPLIYQAYARPVQTNCNQL
jgi:hypothetical protein